MLVFQLGTSKLKIDFSFAAIVAIYTYLDKQGIGNMILSALLCHESGHLITMLLFELNIEEIVLYGAGIRISSDLGRLTIWKKLIVCSAGCIMNIFLAVLSYCCGAYGFSAINLVMCCFNLLPIGELDGAEISNLLIQRYFSFDMAYSIRCAIQYTSCVLIVILYAVNFGMLSITLMTTTLYIILLAVCKYRN